MKMEPWQEWKLPPFSPQEADGCYLRQCFYAGLEYDFNPMRSPDGWEAVKLWNTNPGEFWGRLYRCISDVDGGLAMLTYIHELQQTIARQEEEIARLTALLPRPAQLEVA